MKAALLTEINQPLVLTDNEIAAMPLLPGQVLVRVLVSGICGKQLGEIAGTHDLNAPRPRLLGHEGCGIVDQVGPGSTKFHEGQKVIMHWRKGSGMESEPPRYVYQGRQITSGQVTTFSEFSICSENRLTAVPHETPNELCALLGCGLSTALGVMENEAKLKAGESVLIVGCGGVGLNLIRVARMMGAAYVTAYDTSSAAEQRAAACGATDPGRVSFDVIVDTTGYGPEISRMMQFLAPSGRFIMVGQPAPNAYEVHGMRAQYNEASDVVLYGARHLFDGEGKTIKATQGGGFSPDRDIPRYLAMWKSGHLKIDQIVTNRFPFEQINEALDAVRSGSAGRAMIEMV